MDRRKKGNEKPALRWAEIPPPSLQPPYPSRVSLLLASTVQLRCPVWVYSYLEQQKETFPVAEYISRSSESHRTVCTLACD